MDIRTHFGKTKFDVRSCGFLLIENNILISCEQDGTFTLNGGAVKIGETSEQAVIREFKEETGLDVEIVELRALIENRFSTQSIPYQQILFVYKLQLSTEKKQTLYFSEKEQAHSLWMPINEATMLRPAILNTIIQQTESSIQHYINFE